VLCFVLTVFIPPAVSLTGDLPVDNVNESSEMAEEELSDVASVVVPTPESVSRDPPVVDVSESSEMAEELSHTDITDILFQLKNSGLPDNTILSIPKGILQQILESGNQVLLCCMLFCLHLFSVCQCGFTEICWLVRELREMNELLIIQCDVASTILNVNGEAYLDVIIAISSRFNPMYRHSC